MTYEFTVFISYPRGLKVRDDGRQEMGDAGEWVHDLLAPRLTSMLPEFVQDARVGFDGSFEPGARSEGAIKRTLQRSRCMLAVWSAQYFVSPWCRSEWHTMRQREDMVTQPVKELVIPLQYADGESFDEEARARCAGLHCSSVQRFTVLRAVNERHERFPDFREWLRSLCGLIRDCAKRAPSWRDDFPWHPMQGLPPEPPFDAPSLQS